MSELDWTTLGKALRQSADDAHEGETPDVTVAYSFLLSNAELFIAGIEYPTADMPADPPDEFIAAYYEGAAQ